MKKSIRERLENLPLTRNFTNYWGVVRGYDLKTLESLRMAFIGLIIADIFGVYWYLEMKTLGRLLLIIFLIYFGVLLYLERIKKEEMGIMEEETEKKQPKEDLLGGFEGFDLDDEGYLDLTPSSEEKKPEKEPQDRLGLPSVENINRALRENL